MTPTEYGAPAPMESGDECSETWSNDSVVGMLMYPSLNSCTVCSKSVCKVHVKPKEIHEQAIKQDTL